MTRTEEALLAAVVAAPADDLPRLAYADFCEERGDDARGEFIRVQCDLRAIWPGDVLPDMRTSTEPSLPQRYRWIDLRRRERELLHDPVHWWAWLAGLYAVTGRSAIGDMDLCPGDPDAFAVRFRRGFVAEVRLPAADWLAHGPALVRAAPLARVRLGDRQPYLTFTRLWGWSPLEQYRDAGSPAYLPVAVYDLLPEPDEIASPVGLWRTEGLAEDALSAAALAWARAAAVAEGGVRG